MIDQREIDPDVLRFLNELRADWQSHAALDSVSFPEQRRIAEAVRARWANGGPAMERTLECIHDAGAGELRVRALVPPGLTEPAPALVYLHGGGFTLFSIDTHDRLMREYAVQGGFVVIGIDYPLAPEAKFPVALDRIEGFMIWLSANSAKWGIDPARIAMGGDSAGGNLAFATCLRLRERGRPDIVRALLANYGGFSARVSDESEARFGGPESILNRSEADQYWANYLRDERDADNAYACPINADLTGLPPAFLAVAKLDIVAEQSLEMERRLRNAGVAVECRIYNGAIHSFLEAMSISALARKAIADGARFVADAIGARG